MEEIPRNFSFVLFDLKSLMGFDDQNSYFPRHDGESLIAIAKKPTSKKSVFLSSTFEDLKEYIQRVQTAMDYANVVCSSKNWITAYIPTVDECRQRLENSDGYIGIFAYWYGSIPPNCGLSITHLEFQWAKNHWNIPTPPIAIFMPDEPSEAEKHLRDRALKVMSNRGVKQEEHDPLLMIFHQEVDDKREWKLITRFADLADLILKVGLICKEWAGLTPEAAARKDVELIEKYDFRKATSEQFGSLGREKQLGDLKKIINQVHDFAEVPAIAFVVAGDTNAGQLEFLHHIIKKKKIRGRPPKIDTPSPEQYAPDKLIGLVGRSLGLLEDKEADNLEQLARLIHAELRNQNLILILDEVQRYPGGVAAFYETFWSPLYKELEKLQAQSRAPNHLIVIIADYSNKSAQWASLTKEFSGGQLTPADYSKLFLLQLTPIMRADILDWFDEMEVPEERRSQLADIVLKNSDGQIDGTPREVFRKLDKENLWNE